MNKPPFEITNKSLNLMVQISEKIGRLQADYEKQLHLRKNNRLRSIQASLAIENNSMSLEQVTDIINGKRVLGSPKEIQEVKNAYDAYEKIHHFSPYSVKDFLMAHRLMMQGLINDAGSFRTGDVGIFNHQGEVIHMGARPEFVPKLVKDLFDWAKSDDTPALIKSCVIHYELELIHPFADGNGRMGRLWQSVLLSKENPVFEWLPIETMVYEHQNEYYATLRQADKTSSATVFIEFILATILETIQTYPEKQMSDIMSDMVSDKFSTLEKEAYSKIKYYLDNHSQISNQQAQQLLAKSAPTVRRYLNKFVAYGLLQASGKNKARIYFK
ncbi:Fic family protein [Pasteurella skyensis]|uniref:Fic family protein n=1 Tax=Phocoenobacter skyensis TaxID=97481 RepID=A0AAJ6N844_9PAST|nr:Fic family protein [Pasteurella skyensis]MDP8161800.1 Fic family protein [Pasteurella skyensis]MDP8171956.1 Fic family protein [Pasteurella skyensis]MDP8176191.1 Fic family protein [Pasteurella skyensis]MDP8178211.1 Fic family protein [Pasteurella skyensis]MDP8182181.1 Fic family protein [Pasteurella skyensis]